MVSGRDLADNSAHRSKRGETKSETRNCNSLPLWGAVTCRPVTGRMWRGARGRGHGQLVGGRSSLSAGTVEFCRGYSDGGAV